MQMSDCGSPANVGSMEGLGVLPKTDVSWVDGKDQWGYDDYSHAYSEEAMRDYALAEVQRALAVERERWHKQCAGKRHEGCNYVAACGSVCNKCGQVA